MICMITMGFLYIKMKIILICLSFLFIDTLNLAKLYIKGCISNPYIKELIFVDRIKGTGAFPVQKSTSVLISFFVSTNSANNIESSENLKPSSY